MLRTCCSGRLKAKINCTAILGACSGLCCPSCSWQSVGPYISHTTARAPPDFVRAVSICPGIQTSIPFHFFYSPPVFLVRIFVFFVKTRPLSLRGDINTVCCGISGLILCGCFVVIDVAPHPLRRTLQPFRWLGLNAITIYILAEVVQHLICSSSTYIQVYQLCVFELYIDFVASGGVPGRCSRLGLLLVLLIYARTEPPKYILVRNTRSGGVVLGINI